MSPGGAQTIHYDYDASGNLTLKDDYATSYAYQGSRPNAVSSITKVGGGTVNFSYDANGNLLSGDGKALTYTAFNKPATVTAGGVTASFGYGAELSRYRQDKSSGETILYIDKLMEIVQVGSAVEYRHYLGDVAILTKTGALSDPGSVASLPAPRPPGQRGDYYGRYRRGGSPRLRSLRQTQRSRLGRTRPRPSSAAPSPTAPSPATSTWTNRSSST